MGSVSWLILTLKNLQLDKVYQISDKLLTRNDKLESHLEVIESKFHGYKSTIALYDLTNTYKEGDRLNLILRLPMESLKKNGVEFKM